MSVTSGGTAEGLRRVGEAIGLRLGQDGDDLLDSDAAVVLAAPEPDRALVRGRDDDAGKP
jgi:hypothetical protein